MDKTMQEKIWDDFWKNKREFPEWKNKTRAEKAPAYMANADFKVGKLTLSRMEALLKKYAPDRYDFNLTVTIKKETL